MTSSLLRTNTPLEDHLAAHGLLVKREDLSCPPPGPPFSKTRGVVEHVRRRVEEGVKLFGVLDTYHSQAGHAVALACREFGVECWNFYPHFKADLNPSRRDADLLIAAGGSVVPIGGDRYAIRAPQVASAALGAHLKSLPAGRSSVLFHQARRATEEAGGYMMPNALKLPETVEETAAEVLRTLKYTRRDVAEEMRRIPWIVASSSGTIAAGVLRGLYQAGLWDGVHVVVHLGYDRPYDSVMDYLVKASHPRKQVIEDFWRTWVKRSVSVVNEGYAYADKARASRAGEEWEPPPWPANPWYDLKAYRWWATRGRAEHAQAVLWNIG